MKKMIFSIFFFYFTTCIFSQQIANVSFLGYTKNEIKVELQSSSFIGEIKENELDDGTHYFKCNTQGTWTCYYYFDESGKCSKFKITDIIDQAGGWEKILDDEFNKISKNEWVGEYNGRQVQWRLYFSNEAVNIQAAFIL